MDKLLPDRLKQLWQAVDRKELTLEQFNQEQERFSGRISEPMGTGLDPRWAQEPPGKPVLGTCLVFRM